MANAQYVQDTLPGLTREEHPPATNPQTPFIVPASQLFHVTPSRVSSQVIYGISDADLLRGSDPFQFSLRSRRDDDMPQRRTTH